MSKWIEKLKDTLAILGVIAAALGAGVLAGFGLIVVANVLGLMP